MADAGHNLQLGTGNEPGQLLAILRRARIVILTRQQEKRAFGRINPMNLLADIAFCLVVVQIAFEDPRSALHVVPQRLPAILLLHTWSDEAGHNAGANFAAMDIRSMEPA